jgi:hypothetical protein
LHRCTVVFKFFWMGYWGLWENLAGDPLFSCFIAFVWPNFLKSFERVRTWGAPVILLPPSPFVHLSIFVT